MVLTAKHVFLVIFWLPSCWCQFRSRDIRLSHNTFNTLHGEIYKPPVKIKDFVTLIKVPTTVRENQKLEARYQCSQALTILLFVDGYEYDFSPDVDKTKDPEIFYKALWNCKRSPEIYTKNITIQYPEEVLLRPNVLKSKVWNIRNATLKIAMVQTIAWKYVNDIEYLMRDPFHVIYEKSLQSLKVPLKTTEPYCRSNKYSNKCYSWEFEIADMIMNTRQVKSYHDNTFTDLVPFPIITNERNDGGMVMSFMPFINPELRKKRHSDPSFTLSVIFYMTSYCKKKLCGLFYQITSNEEYATPGIFITNEGSLYIQCKLVDGNAYAYTPFPEIPLKKWTRVVVQQRGRQTNITLGTGENFSETKHYSRSFHMPVDANYTDGYMVMGGSLFVSSLKGIIGEAKFWRNTEIQIENLPIPKRDHLMYNMGFEKYIDRAEKTTDAILRKKNDFQANGLFAIKSDVCPLPFYVIINKINLDSKNMCMIYQATLPKRYNDIAQQVVSELDITLPNVKYIEQFSQKCYDSAMTSLRNNNYDTKEFIRTLELAARLGHHHSSFILYAIYINGIGIPIDEKKARLYLLTGVYNGCRLCSKTLGAKYLNGEDGFPKSPEVSFYYYFMSARMVQEDSRKHVEGQAFVNDVRLNNEKEMKNQLNEDEDVFKWLKFQAGKGMFQAKRSLARMLFWGEKGLKRDLHQAFEYYKEAAAAGDDPTAIYDYGVSLMQGFGTEKDIEAGVVAMEKAAALDNVPALNSLGWYYTTQKKDQEKAAEYFEKASKLGNRDATYNIGHMYHSGQYPNHGKDLVKAFKYYYQAATRNHMEAMVYVSHWHATGLTGYLVRNINFGILWARHISNLCPDMGEMIRKALQAYRTNSILEATILYIAAAETGFEVAGFNAAFMLDDHKKEIAKLNIQRDCEWRFWNASARTEAQSSSYAVNKMGDYYYYGINGTVDIETSTIWYAKAASMKNPQAIFNLALIVEKEKFITPEAIELLKLNNQTNITTNDEIILYLYKRCIEVTSDDTRVPCYLGLIRVQTMNLWNSTELYKKIFACGFIGVLTVFIALVTKCFKSGPSDTRVEQGNLDDNNIGQHTGLLQDTTIENEIEHHQHHEHRNMHHDADTTENNTIDNPDSSRKHDLSNGLNKPNLNMNETHNEKNKED